MTQVSTPMWTLRVAERENTNRLAFQTGVTTSGADTLPFAVTMTAIDLVAQSWRWIGAEVYIDKGTGALERLAMADLPESITVRGSLDGYGARQVTFGWQGAPSPLIAGALRAARRVKVIGLRGIPGGVRKYPLFDGRLQSAEYQAYPPTATITAQDQLLGLAQPLSYTLAARSLVSRDAIIRDICARVRVPVGTFTWPASFPNGGYAVKEIVEAGDKTVGAFLAEYLAPVGCRYYQRDGKLHIMAFSSTDTPVRTLPLSLIRGLRTAPPGTDVPNTIRLTSGIYGYTGPNLTGTTETTVEVPFDAGAGHVVRVAFEKQDHTTGAITSVSPSSSPGANPWSRVVTETTRVGGNITRQVVTTYGWKAPVAARQKLASGGGISHNDLFDCYHYNHDDSWRTQQAETFQIVSQVTITRWFEANNGRLVYDDEIHSLWRQDETYRATIANGTNTETGVDCYILSDGRALNNAKEEFIPFADVVSTHHFQTAGPYTQKRITGGAWFNNFFGREMFPIVNYTPPDLVTGGTLYVFGPAAAKRYARPWVWAASGTVYEVQVDIVYADSGTASHTETTSKSTLSVINATALTSRWGGYVAGVVSVNTLTPIVEQLTSVQVPEPASITCRDRVRLAMCGGVAINQPADDAWCENTAEMTASAIERMREIAAIMAVVETDLDWSLSEGDVVTIPAHPKFGGQAVDLLIWSQEATLNLRDASNTHVLECRLYPTELE